MTNETKEIAGAVVKSLAEVLVRLLLATLFAYWALACYSGESDIWRFPKTMLLLLAAFCSSTSATLVLLKLPDRYGK